MLSARFAAAINSGRLSPDQVAELLRDAEAIRVVETRRELRESLYAFVEYFWTVLEPETPFVGGWVIEAICLHLEAVTRGEIKRLLINVPPGSSKSIICNAFWPAWEWAQSEASAATRWLSFSYSIKLTAERDNGGSEGRLSRLLLSEPYRQLFGHIFRVTKNNEAKISNNRTGWKQASSIDGVATGARADRVVCFPRNALVETERGPIAIGDIVDTRMEVRAWSMNLATEKRELRPIVGWHKNPASDLVRVNLSDGGQIICTPEHQVWTSRGWVAAQDLRAAPSGVIVSAPYQNALRVPEVRPCTAIPDGADRADMHSKFRSEVFADLAKGPVIDFSRQLIRKVCRTVSESSVFLAIRNILVPRSVFEVVQPCVGSAWGFVPNFLAFRGRADKGKHDKLVAKPVDSFSAILHGNARIAFVENGGENTSRYSKYATLAAAPDDFSRQAAHAAHVGDLVIPFESRDGKPRFVVGVEIAGHAEETFCLTVEGNHNMFVGLGQESYLVSNCDDPHSVKEGESDAVRTSTVEWFANTMSNRLNSLEDSAIIVIMQRVHEADVSGYIIARDLGYEHLMIPAYSDGRRCQTCIGWIDPREDEGINYWPERFSDGALMRLKATMLDFAWAGQYQQIPEVRGGGLFKRDWWRSWDRYEAEKWDVKYPQFPKFDLIVASLDTAYTEKKESDPSAMTVWGISNRYGRSTGIFLLAAWQAHIEFHDLLLRVAETCSRWRVDKLLVEGKASGISILQELRRTYGKSGWSMRNPPKTVSGDDWERREQPSGWIATEWSTVQIDPGNQSKIARATSVVELLYDGLVYAPMVRVAGVGEEEWKWTTFADLLIDQAAVFPRGQHDDLCLVAGTLIETSRGCVRIETLRADDRVLTPDGFKEILATGFTGVRATIKRGPLEGTENHPVFTLEGYAKMNTLTQASKLQGSNLCGFLKIALLKSLYSTAWNTGGWAAVAATISRNRNPMRGVGPLKACMLRFGSFIHKGQFRRAMKFTIAIATHLISSLTIWNASRKASTGACRSGSIERSRPRTSLPFVALLRRGISQMKAALGIATSRLSLWLKPEQQGSLQSEGLSLAYGAAKSSDFFRIEHFTARQRVSVNYPLSREDLEKESTPSMREVFNLTVEGAQCYFANGVLVHNCDTMVQTLRYLRDNGMASLPGEASYAAELDATWGGRAPPPIYPGAGL